MKLFVAAVVTSTLLLFGSAALAQQPPDPAKVGNSATDVGKTAACPVAGNVPPAAASAQYQELCAGYPQSIDPSAGGVIRYACHVSGAVIKGINDNGGSTVGELLSGVRAKGCVAESAGSPPSGQAACTANCDPGRPTPPGSTVLGDGDDGSLPRTGAGGLVGALGLGLLTLGGVIRRLLF